MPSSVAEMISAEVSSASGVFSATMKDAMRLKFMSCATADPAQSARTEVSVKHRTDHVGSLLSDFRGGADPAVACRTRATVTHHAS
jgi:hypothetical protein